MKFTQTLSEIDQFITTNQHVLDALRMAVIVESFSL